MYPVDMRQEVLEALSSSPKVVERLLRVFPSDRFDYRYGGARFNPREVVASLADNEVIILDRIRMANLRPGSAVESIDPVERAKEHHYSDKDVFHEAEVYESRRQTTVEYLRELNEDDWSKTFVLSGVPIAISEYASLILSNDLFHMDQMSLHVATEAATIS
jgi:hypothetical protein